MVSRPMAALLALGSAVTLVGCTDSAPPPTPAERPVPSAVLAEGVAGYRRYVAAQADALVARTQEFVDAVKAGQVDRARDAYALARTHYERIEPVVEPFVDLDRRIDGREDGVRGPDGRWTGFHRLEKDLWADGLRPDSGAVADQLAADVGALRERLAALTVSAPELAENAKAVLDDIASRKLDGREERYSGTDLWDLEANIEGIRTAIDALRPAIDQKDPTLGPVLDRRFAALAALLTPHRSSDGFTGYAELTRNDIKAVTDAVDALSEPVSQVAGVITS